MIDKLAINTLKINSISAINEANSGHPGIALGAATMMHTLFSKHLNFDPKNPK
jgi:transketolase